MIVLAIDPGTSCGWAIRYENGAMDAGTWDLSSRRHEGGGMRFVRLRSHLANLIEAAGPTLIAYEEVCAHRGTDAGHIYGGIIAVISEECEARKIPYQGIPVGTVKKHATGKGNADKVAMVKAANARWGLSLDLSDNNEADARWIAETAIAGLR